MGRPTVARASAPGKLVLLGEYAVLDGAPGLVVAVDRRVEVEVSLLAQGPSTLLAPELGLVQPQALDSPVGLAGRKSSAVVEAALAGAVAAVRARGASASGSAAPLAVRTRSAAFLAPDGQKLGLGASAAIATATSAAALRLLLDSPLSPAELLACVVASHRQAQGGVGSGIDVAASCMGGLVAYRIVALDAGAAPRAEAVPWPSALHGLVVFSGRSANTAEYIAKVRAFAGRAPTAHRALVGELGQLAAQGVEAAQRGAVLELLSVVRAYGEGLARLGGESGADIDSAAHRRWRAIVSAVDGVYKPSGAGGGDVGVALSTDPTALARAATGLAAEGAYVVALTVGERGVFVTDGAGEWEAE